MDHFNILLGEIFRSKVFSFYALKTSISTLYAPREMLNGSAKGTDETHSHCSYILKLSLCA